MLSDYGCNIWRRFRRDPVTCPCLFSGPSYPEEVGVQICKKGFKSTIAPGRLALAALFCLSAAEARAAELNGGTLRWTAQGDQIYRCSEDGGLPHWVLERPQAVLKDQEGLVKAEHGAGPTWRADDGSEVQGVVVTVIPAPKPDAISWLVLRVSGHAGHGLLDDIAYILRTDTDGGIAPETGCDMTRFGRLLAVPYGATYTFIAGVGLHARK